MMPSSLMLDRWRVPWGYEAMGANGQWTELRSPLVAGPWIPLHPGMTLSVPDPKQGVG